MKISIDAITFFTASSSTSGNPDQVIVNFTAFSDNFDSLFSTSVTLPYSKNLSVSDIEEKAAVKAKEHGRKICNQI
ncbi:hypothetical protein Xsto_04132 [Xenorhabdus stockiae]|uniref:Uncharacterized protein n=1 Tax=Xenorhabdus stockiae TaxID=351614 RepID=A0A2D0K462_9GAMM|nr:hypothetical protein [Xenorhabdus stockiae]PHM56861.1 hypothetical protein Xsto_04132 [Xenorhabdus stockiae]